jgi:glucosylglycerate synthase
MASIPSQPATAAQTGSGSPAANLLVSLAPQPQDALESTLSNLSQAFAGRTVLVATSELPVGAADAFDPELVESTEDAAGYSFDRDWASRYSNLQLLTEPLAVPSSSSWLLTAADFLNAYKLAQQHGASACMLLGAEAQSLAPEALRSLAAAVGGGGESPNGKGADLAVPRYEFGPRDGLVNSALLYPVSRAVYGARPRFPLAIDLGLSLRMAERLATSAQRFTASGQNDAMLWPVAEAAVAGYTIAEVNVGGRAIPQPTSPDLNSLLARVTSSLFSDVEARAAFWQRSRIAQPNARPMPATSGSDGFADLEVQPMLDSFRLAYTNLQEIWSLVLPPNSLLGLKRLATSPAETFRMPDALWVRIVYDLLLAFRLRTINRGHLLGALTPLYLAWVASHILYARSGVDPEHHVEELAQAFEFDKPYLVSRWRWPDRFNP